MKTVLWYRAEQTCLDTEKCVPAEDKTQQVNCNTQCLVGRTCMSMPPLEDVQHYKDLAIFFQDGMHIANNKLKVANDTLNATKRTLDNANDALNATNNRLKSYISANNHLVVICNGLEKELSEVRAQLWQQKECENVLPDDIIAENASTTNGIDEKQTVDTQTNRGDENDLQVHQTTLCNNEVKKRTFSNANNTIEVGKVVLMPEHKKMKRECLCPCVKFDTFFNLHSASKLLVLCKYVCVVLDNVEHCVTTPLSTQTAPLSTQTPPLATSSTPLTTQPTPLSTWSVPLSTLSIHTKTSSTSIETRPTPSVSRIPSAPWSKCYTIIRLETLVCNAIDAIFDGFIHNKMMITSRIHSRHKRRIDHRLLICNTILAIETDEYAHRSYTNAHEMERYHDFMRSFSYKFVFIRFNPHANREKCGEKTDLKHKLRVLMHNITIQMDRIRRGQNTKKLEIIKMFY